MMRAAGIALVLAACAPDAADVTLPLPRVRPESVGLSSSALDSVTGFLQQKVAEDAFPGGVLAVGRHGVLAYLSTVGRYGDDDPRAVAANTIYDLASLTKVIGLTTATMLLVADGRLDIERPVAEYVPEFRRPDVTVRHLLTHTSGLEAWVPLYSETEDAGAALRYIYQADLQGEPGTTYTYSDLGAILWTQVVQRVAGAELDSFLHDRVFGPLSMTDTRFRPPASLVERIAPTEQDPWRGRMIRGEVHDENAAHLGGVSGHAGLFSTAPDLARFAIWLLDSYHDRVADAIAPRLPAALVRQFTARQPGPEGSTRALGWDTPTPGGGASSGHLLSASSFGHTGFTGTSIWIDPERDLFIILLTNRVHPTRENRALLPLRGIVADMVVEAIVDTKNAPS